MNKINQIYERLKYLPEAGGNAKNNTLARVYPVVVPSAAPVCFPIITYAMAGGADNPPEIRGPIIRPLIRISVIAKETQYSIIQETMDAALFAIRKLFYVDPDPPVDSYNEIIDAIEQTVYVSIK